MSEEEKEGFAKSGPSWGTFSNDAAAGQQTSQNETSSSRSPTGAAAAAAAAAAAFAKSSPPSKRPTMRTRVNSGELFLKASPDGLVMSPALHRRRVISGLAPLKEGSGSKKDVVALRTSPQRREQLSTARRLSDQAAAAAAAGHRAAAAASDDDDEDDYRRTRQRSSTWDEHGIAKQLEDKRMMASSLLLAGDGGDGGGGGRVRTWSHNGALRHVHGQGARPSSEWEHLDAFQAMGSMFQQELYHEKSSGLVDVLFDRMRVPLLIVLVGILAALAGMFVSFLSGWARMWRITLTVENRHLPFEWVIYGAMSLSLTLGMCAITHFVCPCASGGGVPEMKAVLSGSSRPGLLSAQLVLVKMTGVITANAAGLSVGKEGPLIHITCAMADILMSTPWFKKVRLNNKQRLGILACACAAGVAATFGSVFGGTLFSVEVTATAYMVDTLPATFLCAVVVAVVFWLSGQGDLFALISDNTAQAQGFTATDLMAWAVLGAVCGLVGAWFVAVLDALSRRRNFFTRKDLDPYTRRKRMFVVVALATLLVIPASFTEDVAFSDFDHTGRAKYHPFIDSIYDQTQFGMSWRLINLLLIKFWTTIFSVVQPLPVGLFSPIFVIGGLMGRIFGEIANWVDHCMDSVNINFQPWEFALIGSAAFSAGVTRAVSTAVIVFELSGENHLRLPLGVALMISYFIANRFTKGVYDALMDTNKTPHLEEVPPEDQNVPAEDVMIKVDEIPCLSLDCTGSDASEVASRCQPGQFIPVVQSMSDKVLVGVVLWNDLAIALADYRRRGSSIIAISSSSSTAAAPPINSSRGTPPPLFASTTTMIDGRRYQVLGGGGDSGAAAAAAAGGGRFEWEESSEEGGEGDGSGGNSWWPRLAGVGEAIGRRMGWFPMVRTAEASLLRELDRRRAETMDEGRSGATPPPPPPPPPPGVEGAGKREDGYVDDDAASLSPLGEGIPLGGGGTAAAAVGAGNPTATSSGRRVRSSRKALSPAPAPPVPPVAGIEKAKRAPIRFYLVREGHRFVPVGRNPKKGAWKELPEVAIPAARESIPVVLDPSPYQVSHTTELSKVDIAFRLLRLDNAYVCNAGRLVGVITREALADFVDDREVSPMDDCVRLCGALACCLPGRAPADDDNNAGASGLRRRISRRSISRSKLAASSAAVVPPGGGGGGAPTISVSAGRRRRGEWGTPDGTVRFEPTTTVAATAAGDVAGTDLDLPTSTLLGGGDGGGRFDRRGYSNLGDENEGGSEEVREGEGEGEGEGATGRSSSAPWRGGREWDAV